MPFLRDLFGPSREAVWEALSLELGGRYIPGDTWNPCKVQVRHGEWWLTLDAHTVTTGRTSAEYTRLRAPFVNRDGFRFSIHRAGLFTELGKAVLGTQDLEFPADPLFDKQFVIQSNSPPRLYELLRHEGIRARITAQPEIHFTLRDAGTIWEQKFPDGVDELYFEVIGVIRDPERLRLLFELFADTLNLLGHLDSGHQHDVDLLLADLTGPGGAVAVDQAILWNGDLARRHAATALGALGDPRAVPALMAALTDPDRPLRALAVEALTRIKDPSAAPALLPLLADRVPVGGRPLAEVVDEAMGSLGRADWARAFREALAGEPAALTACGDAERAHSAAALRALLATDDLPLLQAAARALTALRAAEAAPEIARAAHRVRLDHAQVSATLAAYAAALKRDDSLPRPASARGPEGANLPGPSAAPLPDPENLPGPSDAGSAG